MRCYRVASMVALVAVGPSLACWADFPDSRYVVESGGGGSTDGSSGGGNADTGTTFTDAGGGSCKLGTAARCQGGNLVWCSSTGSLRTTRCPGGCKNGTCCKDNDGDGVSECQGDCDDNDRQVSPRQDAYFASPRKKGGFDYNCNGKEEKRFSAQATSCTRHGGTCQGEGWQGSVPDCGKDGTWQTCSRSGRDCNSSTATSRQRCR